MYPRVIFLLFISSNSFINVKFTCTLVGTNPFRWRPGATCPRLPWRPAVNSCSESPPACTFSRPCAEPFQSPFYPHLEPASSTAPLYLNIGVEVNAGIPENAYSSRIENLPILTVFSILTRSGQKSQLPYFF